MKRLPLSVLLFTATCALHAQSVTATISASTPITVDFTAPGQTVTDTQPVGPLTTGQIEAQASFFQYARTSWYVGDLPGITRAEFSHSLSTNDPTATAAAGPHEFEVEFTAPASAPGGIWLRQIAVVSAGEPTPSVTIKLDGNFYADLLANQDRFIPGIQFGTQPTRVQVIMHSTMQGPGQSTVSVQVDAVPQNQLTSYESAAGCAAFQSMELVPVFEDRGIDCRFVQQGSPVLLVVGLAQMPVLLPPFVGPVSTQTCLLLPSVDIVGWNLEGIHHIALPAAVRPVVFHAQGVALTLDGLLTTDAHSVYAQ